MLSIKKQAIKILALLANLIPIKLPHNYAYHTMLEPSEYEQALKEWYEIKTNSKLNLDNPQTFNEKIQWLKLYDSTPLKTRLADKYLVREWIKEKIGEEYLVPLFGVWDSFDEIEFNKLPNQFVLKVNNASGTNVIVKDKSKLDIKSVKKQINMWMRENYAFRDGFELYYMNIPLKIIAEQYMENEDGDLYDYKFFCFNGKVEHIMFLSQRKTGLKMSFYDREWHMQDFVYSHPRHEKAVKKPNKLEKMIELSEILAKDFSHVRVDFYLLNNGDIKFGELTFTSLSGTCKWEPEIRNKIYGDMIILPQEKLQNPEKYMFKPDEKVLAKARENIKFTKGIIKYWRARYTAFLHRLFWQLDS